MAIFAGHDVGHEIRFQSECLELLQARRDQPLLFHVTGGAIVAARIRPSGMTLAAQDVCVRPAQRNHMLELTGSVGDLLAVPVGNQERVARLAILDDRVAVLVDVPVVVTTETAVGVHVADVVGVRRPIDIHLRKDIGDINCAGGVDRLVDRGAARLPEVRVVLAVKTRDPLADPRERFGVRHVGGQERRHRFALDER
ncbi:MAG: hypothetical protein GTO30_05890 [Acidobacteria bacterium]|nr:hypothetical protein [Acidobacteriota bacterium]NIM61189.1 hypothetical protein [Acidobacteriota bacterium]NIO58737.1 hypothetical protein [Acidobacteriota bacterium]NIQ84511.1 hypothetical protein [Acidobacteriota bacterium]NIT10469.1 hypothetical protein [Acidobacteriota bacterium]